MLETIAASLEEIEEFVSKHFVANKCCYRGQSNSTWGLVPSVFRDVKEYSEWEDNLEYVHQCERDCHREFRDEYTEVLFNDIFEWLAFEQHHGSPTRLLDWSHALEFAAFFAVNNHCSDDAAIFVFDMSKFPFHPKLGRQHPNGGFDLDTIRHYCRGSEPIFTQTKSLPINPDTGEYLNTLEPDPDSTFIMWRPGRSHPRLRYQEGLLGFYLTFNAFDIQIDLLDYFLDLGKKSNVEFLAKLNIPCKEKGAILSALHKRRIDEFSMYGGPDNLGLRVAKSRKRMLSYLK